MYRMWGLGRNGTEFGRSPKVSSIRRETGSFGTLERDTRRGWSVKRRRRGPSRGGGLGSFVGEFPPRGGGNVSTEEE